jgi:hypothetical protein
MTSNENGAPPRDLGAAGGDLYAKLTDGVVYRPDEHAILVLACRTADTIEALAEAMEGEPLLTTGSAKQVTVHPAVLELRAQREALARLLARIPIVEDDEDAAAAARRRRSEAGRHAAMVRHHGKAVSA